MTTVTEALGKAVRVIDFAAAWIEGESDSELGRKVSKELYEKADAARASIPLAEAQEEAVRYWLDFAKAHTGSMDSEDRERFAADCARLTPTATLEK